MKGDGKLRLVKSDSAIGDSADEAWDREPTAEELEAAEDLRRSLEAGEGPPTASLLVAAWSPRTSAAAAAPDLDLILARSLSLGEAATPPMAVEPATRLEERAAERLRVELDRDEAPSDGEDVQLARALSAAANPRPISEARNEALIRSALARFPLALHRRVASFRRIAPAAAATVVAITALAAGVALFVGRPAQESGGVASIELARTRSTDSLFDAATPFPRTGDESARVDRIAAARAVDLRRNRFAAWGVR